MSIKNGTTLTTDALSYLVGLIKDISGLDTKLIDNINLKDNGTFSSTKIDLLLRTLKEECNEYSENLCSNLSRLELKLVTSETEITQSNILYLFKPDGQASYNQYVVIDGNKVLLGTCDVSMTDYYTITQVDNKFVLKTDYNDLVNTVNTINDTIGTETLTTTSKTVMGAINELDSKSTMVTLTQAEYNQLVADGKVDTDTYYIINDDSENIDIVQTISSTSTSNQIPSAQAVFNLDSTNFKMNSSFLFNSDTDCTDGKLVIGQEYTAKEPLLPHKMARLNIWWRPCQFTQATWYDDTWGFIDGYFNECDGSVNHLYIYTIRILYRHADTKQFKVAYSKRLEFDLSANTFSCVDIKGSCGFGIQIFK